MKTDKTFEQILDSAIARDSIDDMTEEEHNVFMLLTKVINSKYRRLYNKALDSKHGRGYSASALSLPDRQVPVDETLEGSRRELSCERTET